MTRTPSVATAVLALTLGATAGAARPAAAQDTRTLMPIDFVNSAEFGWLQKPVQARRTLEEFADHRAWRITGTATPSLRTDAATGLRSLRIDMQLFRDTPAPTRNRLSSVNLRRDVANEDWRAYNRISVWVRPDFTGIPVLPLQIVLHNDGAEKVPDRYRREGTHYVSFMRNGWQQVVWEIDPLARDRITHLEIGYWVNRMYAAPGDRVAFEIGPIELQRVDPDVHTGWSPGDDRIAFSHSGYQVGSAKTAIAGVAAAGEFELLRVDDRAFGEVVLRKPMRSVHERHGRFQVLDFSEVEEPGQYVLRAGGITTRPFAIGGDVWKASIWKTLNFFYGNRCGHVVPGVHGIDHLDWFAVHGDTRVVMSGGWHDAGDLSQGVINTGEGTYAMFSLAERLQARGDDPALVERLLEEARWGLEWVLRVRAPGGNRVGFASHNVWSNNVPGDADDRTVEMKNNPNANYIAAAAGAIAARVLKAREPALAARALRIAEDDWAHAIVGVEGPSTWHTPAFAASRMELAAIGITASLELYRATGKDTYRDKAVELARVVMASQQVPRVGSELALSGFFFTGPDRDTLFHQFHRAADQAPLLALSQLVDALPEHPEWMQWYAAVARYAEYKKETARTTAPYEVLPSYVYRLADSAFVPTSGDRYGGTPDAYSAQVRSGIAMGGDWYLRTFPVWYQRRGNYGILLSQAKALSVAARMRGDSAGLELAQRQAQWVVGRNPFAQSTMYGEGYDWAQQYSVSSADFVGSLPVGMQSRAMTDLPYWPSQNMYVYKEVWVHPNIRWLALMEDVMADGSPRRSGAPAFSVAVDSSAGAASPASSARREYTVRVTVPPGEGTRRYTLRAENVQGELPGRAVTLRAGAPVVVEWRVRRADPAAPWMAVVIEDGDLARRRDVYVR